MDDKEWDELLDTMVNHSQLTHRNAARHKVEAYRTQSSDLLRRCMPLVQYRMEYMWERGYEGTDAKELLFDLKAHLDGEAHGG